MATDPWLCDVSDLLPDQETKTERFVAESWVCRMHVKPRSFTPRTHHRLVLTTVGYPLENITGTKELLTATRDAFIGKSVPFGFRQHFAELRTPAITQANAEPLRMIHRDISVGNILLVRPAEGEERKGCLIDWEFSCDESNTSNRIHDLTVTTLPLHKRF